MKNVLIALSIALLLSACKGDKDKENVSQNEESTQATTATSNEESMGGANTSTAPANILEDGNYLAEAENQLRNLPQFKGKDIMVFQKYYIYGDGRITIDLQDPSKPDNIDSYTYSEGQWQQPQPVQISGGGDMASNVFSLSKVPFKVGNTAYNSWNTESQKIGDEVLNSCDFFYVSLWVPNQTITARTNAIETARTKYQLNLNLDGSVKNVEKR